jgi:hypothetical protein
VRPAAAEAGNDQAGRAPVGDFFSTALVSTLANHAVKKISLLLTDYLENHFIARNCATYNSARADLRAKYKSSAVICVRNFMIFP